jgi:hypothetical protein
VVELLQGPEKARGRDRQRETKLATTSRGRSRMRHGTSMIFRMTLPLTSFAGFRSGAMRT